MGAKGTCSKAEVRLNWPVICCGDDITYALYECLFHRSLPGSVLSPLLKLTARLRGGTIFLNLRRIRQEMLALRT